MASTMSTRWATGSTYTIISTKHVGNLAIKERLQCIPKDMLDIVQRSLAPAQGVVFVMIVLKSAAAAFALCKGSGIYSCDMARYHSLQELFRSV